MSYGGFGYYNGIPYVSYDQAINQTYGGTPANVNNYASAGLPYNPDLNGGYDANGNYIPPGAAGYNPNLNGGYDANGNYIPPPGSQAGTGGGGGGGTPIGGGGGGSSGGGSGTTPSQKPQYAQPLRRQYQAYRPGTTTQIRYLTTPGTSAQAATGQRYATAQPGARYSYAAGGGQYGTQQQQSQYNQQSSAGSYSGTSLAPYLLIGGAGILAYLTLGKKKH